MPDLSTDIYMGLAPEKWLADLGVTDAPLTRKGLKTALRFFHNRMPLSTRKDRFDWLKAMDLHYPVDKVPLMPESFVTAYRKHNEDPIKTFYTRRGSSVHSLGVHPEPSGTPRNYVKYRVKSKVVALESRCAAAWDTWSEADKPQHLRRYYEATGGGVQLIIPDARNALEVVQLGVR